ncbi:hypothetical protein ES332_D02G211500v1 [Gossypium tomentosum]|uniref:NADH:ubiquinone oxidoreductase 30kDa subunit domain-containing protein n=1 Tax=Gossypium tomentosum TaxID=34277 RepID=A0A5D2M038_GOSTO|nr:hypothetical protein ES332_D02G211500v1 [Gossypium tomentosum]
MCVFPNDQTKGFDQFLVRNTRTGNYNQGLLYQPPSTSEIPPETFFNYNEKCGRDKKMQGHLSVWLVKHELHSTAVILYAYGYNYLCSQCAYDVALGGLLASVYHLMRIEYGVDQPKEVCIKVFSPMSNPRISSVFGVWKSLDFLERESYDMLGISYENHPRLNRILIFESWIWRPLRKDYIAPNFYEIQDAH